METFRRPLAHSSVPSGWRPGSRTSIWPTGTPSRRPAGGRRPRLPTGRISIWSQTGEMPTRSKRGLRSSKRRRRPYLAAPLPRRSPEPWRWIAAERNQRSSAAERARQRTSGPLAPGPPGSSTSFRRFMCRPFIAAVLIALGAVPASAQSLADVARAEAARRAAVTTPGKLYTNDSLKRDSEYPTAGEPAPAAEQPAAPAADQAKAKDAAKPADAKN